MAMIILTAEDAAKVTGTSPTHPWAALEPVPLADGNYILPEDVLYDPAHADVAPFLATMPIEDVAKEQEFNLGTIDQPGDPADKIAYEAAKLDYAEKGERQPIDETGEITVP